MDNAIIAKLFTETYGVQSFIIRGGNRKKTHTKKNLLQPLHLLDIEASYNPKGKLQQMKELKLNKPYYSIPLNIHKITTLLFLSEVLYKSIREEETDKKLFEFLYTALTFYDQCKKGHENFHLLFLIQLTAYLGFYPTNNFTENVPYFDLQSGYYKKTQGDTSLTQEDSKNFNQLLNTPIFKLLTLDITNKIRSQMLKTILNYYYMHQEMQQEIKSYQILKELYS